MKSFLKIFFAPVLMVVFFAACKKTTYDIGNLDAPTNVKINTEIVGANATNANGDGSGIVKISITANNALGFKIDYDASNPIDLVTLPAGVVTKKYTTIGTNKYTITAVVSGKGGTTTTVTKEITVKSDFTPNPEIVTRLTNGASKTWRIDKELQNHFGVGPYNVGSIRPEWYGAAPNEKEGCCNCFYTARYTFTKVAATNSYTLAVTTPDGVLTKTGGLTTLPGIPSSGGEGCYSYGGGTSGFAFIPAASGAPATASGANFASTQTSILLAGNNTFLGYGSFLKEYEILEITPTTMHLRVQGTETGNAWYISLIAL